MPSENQLAQQNAARALSIKNNSCYPGDKIGMVNTDNEPNSAKPKESTEGEMYGR